MKPFKPQDIPADPGVYVFRNAFGDVIYVGKAKSLRKRMSSYFQPGRSRTADPKVRALINSIADYELIVVRNESEALLLEARLIKQYGPRYNVDLRDDKRYLLIVIDPTEPYPRLGLTRLKKDDGRLYYGPFPNARVLRLTVNWLSKNFAIRTCNVQTPNLETRQHCMARKVKYCSCPCTGKVTDQEYAERVEKVKAVLEGRTREVIESLTLEMRQLAASQRFEDAAKLRDVVTNLKSICDPALRTFSRTTLGQTRNVEGRVEALQEILHLADAPAVIECVDISNISGTLAVGSVVCFRDGRPSVKDYRRYKIRTVDGSNDFAMMNEVITRRYQPVVEEGRGAFPDLLVVDGGQGQLSATLAALHDMNAPRLPVIGIAKQREELILPGRSTPLVLPRHNKGLQLIQSLRDEAHRFALSYHRVLRRKRIADSILDEIEGVGPERRKLLLQTFRSVRRLRDAGPAEIAERVPGIGSKLAEQIHAYLCEHMR